MPGALDELPSDVVRDFARDPEGGGRVEHDDGNDHPSVHPLRQESAAHQRGCDQQPDQHVVELEWRSTRPIVGDYGISARLLDENRALLTPPHDIQPGLGTLPTLKWVVRDARFLDPHPFRERKVASNWLYGSIGLSLMSAVMIYIGWFSDLFTPSVYYKTSLIVVISAMLISLLMFMHNSYDKIIFKSQYGRVKFIEILNKYPDKNTFRKFIARFIMQVKNQKAKKNYSQAKFLTRELQELRRLKNEEVISEREYESGKALIFKHKSFQLSAPVNR